MHLLFDGSRRSRRAHSIEDLVILRKSNAFLGARILVMELSTGSLSDLPTGSFPLDPSNTYRSAQVLVRLHGAPLGYVHVDFETEPARDVLEKLVRSETCARLSTELKRHVEADGLPVPEQAADLARLHDTVCNTHYPDGTQPHHPSVTVAIPTLRNVRRLIPAVELILASTYAKLDVLVVNNDPLDGDVEVKLKEAFPNEPRVRYAHQPIIGVSPARNMAIGLTDADIIIYADDDVVVDPQWAGAIVATFLSDPEIACVTGPILAAEMETRAQYLLEQYGGFDKGFSSAVYDMKANRPSDPMYPFDAGRFGSGANMAFRRTVLEQLGGFSTALGPGTPTWGGEDIDLARRVVWSGHRLGYQPAALVWHFHRRRWDDLTRTMFRYGVGLGSMLTAGFTESPRTALFMLKAIPAGVAHMFSSSSRKNARKTEAYPTQLNVLEIVGLAVGPYCYLRSRLAGRSSRR